VPYEIERHKRFALPAAALVFGLIAFPLAIRLAPGRARASRSSAAW
jgi:lipopolysaccharide export LptBFGC system permease protein LptF